MTEKQTNYAQILAVAESLIQSKGYNAFSYRDIAEIVGIKTSSIHYYFPSKEDLGKVVVTQHLENMAESLKPILQNEEISPLKKLGQFLDCLVAKTYQDKQKMCLGGMLASDVLTLPDCIQQAVQQFFVRITSWISRILTEAIAKKEIKLEKRNIQDEAKSILALFEGSLLLARLFQDEEYLKNARKQILTRLKK